MAREASGLQGDTVNEPLPCLICHEKTPARFEGANDGIYRPLCGWPHALAWFALNYPSTTHP